MKVTIEIDCSAQEARELMGLPDVKKIQDKWLAEIEDKLRSSAELVSPEAIINSWVRGASSNMDILTGLLNAFTGAKK